MIDWKNKRIKFYENTLNINNSNLRFHEHNKNELAHYAKEAWDIEYSSLSVGQKSKVFIIGQILI